MMQSGANGAKRCKRHRIICCNMAYYSILWNIMAF
jgi:hypothetical protein